MFAVLYKTKSRTKASVMTSVPRGAKRKKKEGESEKKERSVDNKHFCDIALKHGHWKKSYYMEKIRSK